jgi:N-dimethylarginine dimethylaminohydrolase
MNYNNLHIPSFLMDSPDSFSTKVANNIWMNEISPEDRKEDIDKAWRQWLDLYNYIAASAYVIVLPELKDGRELQDLVFVANLGIVLHTGQLIISNFTSPPRRGETRVGSKFFRLFFDDYKICPYKFEGEAELKYLHDNIYIGGYGIRSEIKSYQWMMENYDVMIIPIKETDDHCYHLDCSIFPLNESQTMVCTKAFTPVEIEQISKFTEIIDVSKDDARQGIANNLRLHNRILNACDINDMDEEQLHKNQSLEHIADRVGLEAIYFNLSEFEKSGASLSCCVMHLNRNSYSVNSYPDFQDSRYELTYLRSCCYIYRSGV